MRELCQPLRLHATRRRPPCPAPRSWDGPDAGSASGSRQRGGGGGQARPLVGKACSPQNDGHTHCAALVPSSPPIPLEEMLFLPLGKMARSSSAGLSPPKVTLQLVPRGAERTSPRQTRAGPGTVPGRAACSVATRPVTAETAACSPLPLGSPCREHRAGLRHEHLPGVEALSPGQTGTAARLPTQAHEWANTAHSAGWPAYVASTAQRHRRGQ